MHTNTHTLSVFAGLLNLITVWFKFSSNLITQHIRLKPHSAILAPQKYKNGLAITRPVYCWVCTVHFIRGQSTKPAVQTQEKQKNLWKL